ncbi:MAG: citramalate synthase [Blastochloris sp.]|nr:citramalate synthase [Blastochloris sp.]
MVQAQTPVVTLVGKSWTLHVEQVLETSLDENLAMIAESVAYFKALDKEVVYDAEHFFDGLRANRDYALATLRAAAEAGADSLVLCDTNGGALPDQVAAAVRMVREALPAGVALGIHTHNDGALAVANALAAVQAGCTQVQGTINGYGERCGNMDLIPLIANVQLKLGYMCVAPDQLCMLSNLAGYVASVANLNPDHHAAFVGRSAFAHKGGIHVAAIAKVEESYQHIDPALVGNQMRVVVSELSGRGNIRLRAQHLGLKLADNEHMLVQHIKQLENQASVEAAEGSFEMMVRRSAVDYQPPFELLDFTVIIEKRGSNQMYSQATVRLSIGDQQMHTAADGDGPVNALDQAIRKALVPHYPRLADVRLADFKVRIVDEHLGSAATPRVHIESIRGDERWTTMGASHNIIEASWLALWDSLELPLLRDAERAHCAQET